jgi:hypothetical protein
MKILAIALALTLILCVAATAGQNPNAKVAVNVKVHNAKQACATLPVIADCSDIATTYPTYSFDGFPVFFDLVGTTTIEYSLTWPAWTYSCAFNNCADLVIGGIAWPGDGITHAWTSCQAGYSIIGGYGWWYADGPGMICPIPHTESGFIGVIDCDFVEDVPMCVFCAGVFGMQGDDPCDPTATEASTWGGIKSMFK